MRLEMQNNVADMGVLYCGRVAGNKILQQQTPLVTWVEGLARCGRTLEERS